LLIPNNIQGHPMIPDDPVKHYRAIWISDIHLGTRGCKAEFLLDFLRATESERLYLVGDIIDGWQLRKSWYWAQSHNDVIQKILRKARKGTKVRYTPGNHDEMLRHYDGLRLGNIQVADRFIHELRDGRRLLVLHGDQFDGVMRYARWVAHLGDTAYNATIVANHYVNLTRRRLGYPYWSLSAYLKHRVKNASAFIGRFADAVSDAARKQGVDGVVCGHIHFAEMRDIGGLLYCNDGDWVESCTALAENLDGSLEIIHWLDRRALDPLSVSPFRSRRAAREPAGV
jgi:UDP-2,3-diacylglucosamine pyrophosphatase LpxH